MLRTDAVRALCGAVLAAVLGAATAVPATASPAAPTAPAAPATMLAAVQRDLGLTQAQAQSRLGRESSGANALPAVKDALGGSFAGAWFDSTTGRMIVGTTDPARAGSVRAAGAQPQLMQRSGRELEGRKKDLDSRSAQAPDSVTGWYVDPTSNSVVITATDKAAGEKYGRGAEEVRVEVVAEKPRPLADLVGGEAIHAANGGRCSIGFNATRGSSRYVITAGHCTELGGTWSGFDRAEIGPVAESSFPRNDFGTIEVASAAWTQTGSVSDHAGSRISVTGSTPAPVGASTCRSGSTTGYHCGTVETLNQTVNYGKGDVVFGLTRTDACAEPGDSGGPFVSGSQAQGMTSGGSGDCSTGGVTFFQPVNEALSTYGLTLVTG